MPRSPHRSVLCCRAFHGSLLKSPTCSWRSLHQNVSRHSPQGLVFHFIFFPAAFFCLLTPLNGVAWRSLGSNKHIRSHFVWIIFLTPSHKLLLLLLSPVPRVSACVSWTVKKTLIKYVVGSAWTSPDDDDLAFSLPVSLNGLFHKARTGNRQKEEI